MSEPTVKQNGDGLFGVAARAAGTAAQIGLTVTSLPLVLLPAESRQHARKAIAEVARGVIVTTKSIGKAAENVVDDLWAEADAPTTTSNLNLSERARSFANRVASAADDINQGLGTFARRAGDAIERSAADLDAWAQGRPATTPAAEPAKTVDDWVEKKAK